MNHKIIPFVRQCFSFSLPPRKNDGEEKEKGQYKRPNFGIYPILLFIRHIRQFKKKIQVHS